LVALVVAEERGLDPELYLRTVPARIADHPVSRIDELLSWSFTTTLKAQTSLKAV
jgi:hypothetical protein